MELNDKVSWVSTSNGSTTRKTGRIVDVVPPKAKLDPAHRAFGLEGYGMPRDHVSYVVHVDGKTPKSKGRRYWPIASKLVKV